MAILYLLYTTCFSHRRRWAEWCAEFDTRRLFTLPSAEGVACLGCHLTYEFNTSTYDITASLETSHHPVRSLHRFDVDTWILQREKTLRVGFCGLSYPVVALLKWTRSAYSLILLKTGRTIYYYSSLSVSVYLKTCLKGIFLNIWTR